jgi:branched-chain amino acid transport system substrate-binding protein
MNLALEQINAEGGILGKKVEVVVADEVDNLQDSVNAMSKLTSDDSITAIVGSLYSTYCIAALPQVAEAKIPYFSSGSSSGVSKENNPYTWQVRPIDTFQGITLADFAVNTLGMKNPAIMYSTQSALVSLQEQVVAGLKDLGIEITEKNLFGFPEEETNYAPYFAQILAGDYDGLIALSNQMPAALICQQAEIAGIDPSKFPCLGSTSYCSGVCISNAGSSANGWYSVADWVPGGATEAAAAFEEAYVQAYGESSDLPAVSVYDAVYLIKEACEIAGTTDREAINNALKEIKNYPGAISTFSYFDDHCFATSLGITQNIDEKAVMIDSVTFRQP